MVSIEALEASPTPCRCGHDTQWPVFHLQFYDISLSGSQHFLRLLHPDAHALFSQCAERVKELLYYGLDKQDVCMPTIRSLSIILRSMEGGIAHTTSNILSNDLKELHLSAEYVEGLFTKSNATTSTTFAATPASTSVAGPSSNRIDESNSTIESNAERMAAAEKEIRGILVHEMVHAMQFDGKSTCPGGLIEGVADWVRLHSGLASPHWNEGDGGKNWDAGYETTAFFLTWASRHLREPLLVPKLNQKLRTQTWEKAKDVFQRSLDELWTEYKKERQSSSTADQAQLS